MNKYIYLILAVLLGGSASAQVVLRNSGKINVAGGSLVISGSYQNESSGGITLNGIITVSGNWTNNGSGNVIESPGTNGEVIFNGTNQTIGGTGTTGVFDFEKLTILNDSVNVEAGKGVTAYGNCNFNAAPLVLKTTTGDFRPIMATFINKTSNVTGNITSELYYRSTGSSAAPPAIPAGRGLYFSSPISNATANILNVPTNVLYYQNQFLRQYVKITSPDTLLKVGKGYFIRSATHNTFKFTGTPNVSLTFTTAKFPKKDDFHYYLMGNPYPSIINWNTIDKSDNVSTTIWYRTCDANGKMVVADTYNSFNGYGTSNYGAESDPKVDGNIPPMQAFWVICNSTSYPTSGSLTINNTDRSHNWGNTAFFKSSAKQTNDVLRLYLHSGNYRDENIFVQSESAQYSFDNGDSKKLFLGDAKIAELYTVSPNNYNLTIQSVKPITKPDSIIKVGVNVGTAGNYKFTADLSKTNGSHNIYLYDKLEDVKQDLFINPEYTFTSVIENTTSRFSLIFTPVPKLITSAPAYVCYPETVDLTSPSITVGSDNDLTYTYWLNANATISYSTPNKAEAGTYYIKATAANGSYSISKPIEVIVYPAPSVITNAPIPVCSPRSIDLTSASITSGSTNYLSYTYWVDKDATIPYTTPANATSGIYYIKGTSDKGCSTIAGPVQVTINPSPTIITTNPAPIIYPATADLTIPEITFGSSSGLSYSYWLDLAATLSYTTPQAATVGSYYIKGTYDFTGCFAIAGPVIVTANLTGVDDNLAREINIYSLNKQIFVENCKPNSVITIFDITGRLIYTRISKSDKEIIPLNNNTGIYIVKVVNTLNVNSQKVYLR